MFSMAADSHCSYDVYHCSDTLTIPQKHGYANMTAAKYYCPLPLHFLNPERLILSLS